MNELEQIIGHDNSCSWFATDNPTACNCSLKDKIVKVKAWAIEKVSAIEGYDSFEEDEYGFDSDNEEAVEFEQSMESTFDTSGEAYCGGYDSAKSDALEVFK